MTGFIQTEIGILPEDWEAREIKDLVLDTETRNPQKEPTKKIKYIDVSSVSNQTFSVISYQDYLGKDAPGRARKVVYTNDVIFATVRPTLKRVAKITREYNNEYCSTAFCVLRADKNKLDFEFLYQYLLTNFFIKEIAKYQSGASYPAVRDDDVKKTKMPYPPLNEQSNIAKILSIIQSAIETQEKIIRKTTELKKALMQKLFIEGLRGEPQKETEIGQVPKSWDIVNVGDISLNAQYGLSLRGDSKGRYPILRMANQDGGRITTDDLQFVDINKEVFSKFKLNQGDIIFNRTNSIDLVGKTSIFDIEGAYVFASYLIRLQLNNNKIIPYFFNYYFNMSSVQNRLKTIATRGVSQSNISATRLKTFILPLPPLLAEQHEIVKMLRSFDEKLEFAKQKHGLYQSLFRSMLYHLMTGQIRVKDLKFS